MLINTFSLHLPTEAARRREPKRGGGMAALMPDMVSLSLAARDHQLGAWPPQDVRLSAPQMSV